jgi:hypothetical protein
MSEIIEIKDKKVLQFQDYPGLLSVHTEHVIEKSKTSVVYSGPKIPAQEWKAVLAFFKWTYDTTKSESQVRGYVNPKLGTWRFWAYPQEASRGMSAKEIVNADGSLTADGVTQRAQFSEVDGWQYYATIHHHCSAGAFQSGTDRDNEKDQAGLHITVGHMDKPVHDLHCRFYHQKKEYTVDLSAFWDVGDTAKEIVPENMHHLVAEHQMAQAADNHPFPDLWKENVIEVKRPVFTPSPIGFTDGRTSGTWTPGAGETYHSKHAYAPGYVHKTYAEEAVEYLLRSVDKAEFSMEEVEEALQTIDPLTEALCDACRINHCDLDDIRKAWTSKEDQEQAILEMEEEAKKQTPQTGSVWDGYGGYQ